MPLIKSYIPLSLSDQQKDNIKSQLGKLIATIPGKTENWLMVQISDSVDLYFKGTKGNCAYFDVRIFGTTTKETKDSLVNEITNYISQELNLPSNNIYVTIMEIDDWGWNGLLL